ncbi:DUF481 domain-containing protein [Pedobacter mucosus]|uniref:DUF481 domain-containing protein n=1 Tax=Pedobacter mucosus TaxID=2895286 RepID=UPI001EE43B1C|nr:DUF481 domain-containing protein [Pedobacter mucosus]UKT62590.1 DUF481 domain-containing protein [Pedobacter mucosus]
MKIIGMMLLTIAMWLNAKAQFSDSTNYHFLLSSSGSINRTNSDRAYLLNNAINFGLKKNDIELNSSTSWLYGKQNKSLSNNDFSSALNFNLHKTFPHFYYWGLLNYNTSYSLNLRNQLLTGAGIAYNIIDRKNAYLNVSNGVLFDQSSLIAAESYHTFRNSLRIQYHFAIKELITIDGNNFLQNSYARKGDYIIRSSTVLGLKIRKWISLTTALNFNKLNITRSENLNLTYGISLDKYF